MTKAKTGVMLIQLGTPDSTKTSDVRSYLREFLMDGRVIDIPFIPRWMLVNLIISTFRAPKSAAEYRKVWTDKGSPLLYHAEELTDLVQKSLGEEYVVSFGMRYKNPSLEAGLQKIKEAGVKDLIVIPLYPQYASATTGSSIEKFNEVIRDWQVIPNLKFVSNFLEFEPFIEAFKARGEEYIQKTNYDHFIFTYHGLPERQIHKASQDNFCKLGNCCNAYHEKNRFCYRAQCFETTRLITKALNITEDQYTVCFQSRLGKDPWIQPYTEQTVVNLAKEGKKKVLAFSPSFIADCLETTVEVGEMYKEEFEANGGEQFDLVESLNTTKPWVSCVGELVKSL